MDVIHQSLACCMQRIMSLQKNFATKKPKLQILIKESGHKCYFLPKFHCKLNPIEMYWGWVCFVCIPIYTVSAILRNWWQSKGMRALANGTFPTGKHLAPELLNTCLVNTIQAFFHKSWHYMDAYRFIFTHYCSGFSWWPLIILQQRTWCKASWICCEKILLPLSCWPSSNDEP